MLAQVLFHLQASRPAVLPPLWQFFHNEPPQEPGRWSRRQQTSRQAAAAAVPAAAEAGAPLSPGSRVAAGQQHPTSCWMCAWSSRLGCSRCTTAAAGERQQPDIACTPLIVMLDKSPGGSHRGSGATRGMPTTAVTAPPQHGLKICLEPFNPEHASHGQLLLLACYCFCCCCSLLQRLQQRTGGPAGRLPCALQGGPAPVG